MSGAAREPLTVTMTRDGGRRRARIRNELVSGFAAVLALSGLVSYVAMVGSSRGRFDELVERNDVEAAEGFAKTLSGLYRSRGSWEGIGAAFDATRVEGPPSRGSASSYVERHRGKGSDLPLILTDVEGAVVHSWLRPAPDLDERNLPSRLDVSRGVPVEADGLVAGLVFFKSMIRPTYDPQEAAYRASIARSVAMSIGAALVLAIALGSAIASRFARRISVLDATVRSIEQGNLGVRIVADGRDEIGSLGDSINAMADRLDSAEAARQGFLADLSHELRTPVSVIQANLEMMLEGVYEPDEARLRSLYEETRVLSDLIGDLRTLSDLEAGSSLGDARIVDIAGLLEETRAKYQALFLKRGMSLALDARGCCEALASEDRIRQVVRNLLTNALKYALGGTVVTLSCRLEERDGVRLVRVAVVDDGPGVPEAELGRIFERFYRVDASRSRDSGGRGLGLAICKQFVEADGGSIVARNRKPRGLEVCFDLPGAITPIHSA